jgi:HPt (histidine-containing phosphotransfer) domain-containing protein
MIRRHAALIGATAAFALLVLGLLSLTFYTAAAATQDLAASRLAGRQLGASQRIARNLLELDAMRAAGQPYRAATLTELRNAAAMVQSSLTTLRQGGSVAGLDGRPLGLDPADAPRARELLDRLQTLWMRYQERLIPLQGNDFSPAQLADALAYSQASNAAILAVGSDLVEELQQQGAERSAQASRFLTGGVVLALGLFVLILLMLLHRLRVTQEKGEAAYEMTREILGSVREGVLMLMPDYSIGPRLSRSAHGMFGRTLHVGDDFFSQLAPLVNEKVRMDARAYVGRLFGPQTPDGVIHETNPLQAVEVQARTKVGQMARRHLSFQFHRMYTDGMVDHLLVTIQDTTARTESERKLQEERARAQKDFSMLLTAFDADPAVLRQFVERAEAALLEVNDMLGSANPAQGDAAVVRLLDRATRHVHALGRDAAAISLDSLASMARQLENELQRLQVSGGNAHAMAIGLQSQQQALSDMLAKIASLKGLARSPRLVTDLAAGEPINDAILRVAAETALAVGVTLEPVARMGSHSDLERRARELVREIAIQLTRHAVAHGIEPPEAREQAGKPASARLEVALLRGETDWTLSVRDDGAGISAARVRQRLVELGWYRAPQLDSFDERQIVAHIFKPGFSMSDAAGGTPGRAVGLDVVQANVQRLGGRMTVSAVPGQSTEFRIRFPV